LFLEADEKLQEKTWKFVMGSAKTNAGRQRNTNLQA